MEPKMYEKPNTGRLMFLNFFQFEALVHITASGLNTANLKNSKKRQEARGEVLHVRFNTSVPTTTGIV